ncbi:glycoside hydrolase, partial [Thozetella sp. PMI_491]
MTFTKAHEHRSVLILTLVALWLCLFSVPAAAQDCSATKLCATGCCSKFGFCGTGDDHCGDGCQSTCDYQPPPTDCSASQPCADGSCCSKFGFCGLGEKYCAPDVCVNGCTAKADCDPGDFGADYVVSSKCPLNVCCSKWGYCGVDDEHCAGQPKPNRPSCDSTGSPIRRVVGYFEGWASRRPCKQFFPENVPVGVYSHLNFAFASVDPATFAIVPADPADVELYKRLTDMKNMDPQLKVYIAIGGWAFNDPGPTANVFSQLAASESNQNAFFKSLISFMETYGFDGVDIDWEYPAADDRFGQPEDFANFPKFVENLNKAVKSTSRGGLTITLPVAYWYLRHFDIKKLQQHVDWFNLMSYDLHGAWDKENKWIGNYLNSHTNLTEITEYFDLMWRNDIDPAKVVMGLGFYSRTFKPSDPGCTDACKNPKTDADCCKFSTVGDRGACTHEYGVLSNGEIDEVIKETGATPQLDQDAAVQILKVNGEWITYDNVDSWKLKVAFARSECLGGVMVWA